jgi:peptidoglycan/xylan/chitin deacetylase (PgdA/CDA1 family)
MRQSLLDYEFVREYLDGKVLCSVATSEKRTALTFDDGPNPNHTPPLLDILKAKGIRATFFLVGRRVRRHPEIARRIAAEGHEIGNHGFHHIPMNILVSSLLEREVAGAERVIHETTQIRPRYFRPPMGWINPIGLRVVRRMGYEPVIGTIHPRDFTRPGTEVIVERVLERIAPGAIIILHDGGWWSGVDRSQTVEAVDRITDLLGREGYRFETLSQLTGSDGAP